MILALFLPSIHLGWYISVVRASQLMLAANSPFPNLKLGLSISKTFPSLQGFENDLIFSSGDYSDGGENEISRLASFEWLTDDGSRLSMQ